MKNFVKSLKNFVEVLKSASRTALAAIAVLAIAGYVFPLLGITSQWWALMLTAAVTGLLAWLLTPLLTDFKIANAIIPVGTTLLLIVSFKSFLVNFLFWKLIMIMIITSFVIEIVNQWGVQDYWKSVAKNLLLDVVICFFAAKLISYINTPVVTIISLLIAYALIICINISFTFHLNFNIKNN